MLSSPVENYIVDTESNGNILYYIGKQARTKALYRYDFENKSETLLLKDVEKMAFDFRSGHGVVVGFADFNNNKNANQWILKKINLQNDETVEFAAIEKISNENIISDPFYNSL